MGGGHTYITKQSPSVIMTDKMRKKLTRPKSGKSLFFLNFCAPRRGNSLLQKRSRGELDGNSRILRDFFAQMKESSLKVDEILESDNTEQGQEGFVVLENT